MLKRKETGGLPKETKLGKEPDKRRERIRSKRKETGGLPKETKLGKEPDKRRKRIRGEPESGPNYPAIIFLLAALVANFILLLSLMGVLK